MSSHPVPEPVLPEYGGACTSGIIPALVGDPDDAPDWMQASAVGADQTVVLVLDGLGWEQFRARQHLVPTLAAMDGRSITTVAPSTTATALTSITTGLPPGQHGVMGYRMAVDRDVLNVLRWTTYRGDARQSIPPRSINANDPFGSQRPPIVVRAEFEHSGFTAAHLHNARLVGYRMPSTMVIEVARLARAGEPFIYVYYDGIDKVAHEYGLGEHYEAELVAVEWMIKYLVEVLPPRSALVITADHGHIEVPTTVRPHPEVMSAVDFQSGEARFRGCMPARRRQRAVGATQSTTATWPGWSRASSASTTVGSGPSSRRPLRAAWATSPSCRSSRSPSRSRPTRARTSWWVVTDRSRRPRCWCRSSSLGNSGSGRAIPQSGSRCQGSDVESVPMSDPSQAAPESPSGGTTEPEVVSPDLVSPEQAESTDQEAPEVEPAKIIRIGGMVKQLLEEVRNTTLDEAARDSLRDIYENSLTELRSALSPDLDAELERLTLDFDDDTIPSEAQLRIAKAQLVGWLEGLFHGIQATLMAQQMAARNQLETMRGQLGPGGPMGGPGGPGPGGPDLPTPGGPGYI